MSELRQIEPQLGGRRRQAPVDSTGTEPSLGGEQGIPVGTVALYRQLWGELRITDRVTAHRVAETAKNLAEAVDRNNLLPKARQEIIQGLFAAGTADNEPFGFSYRLLAALGEVAWFDVETTLPFINGYLRHPEMVIRREAVGALGGTRQEQVVPALETILTDTLEASEVRSGAITALGKVGTATGSEAVVEILGSELISERGDHRRYVAGVLGELGSPRAVEILFNAFQIELVRWGAREGLWILVRDQNALTTERVIQLLQSEDPDVRQCAVWILAQPEREDLAGLVAQVLADKNKEVAIEAVMALVINGTQLATEVLVNGLQSRQKTLRLGIVNGLSSVCDSNPYSPNEVLVEALMAQVGREKETQIKKSMISTLGSLAREYATDQAILKRILESIENCLSDKTVTSVALAVLEALGREGLLLDDEGGSDE